MTKDASPSYSWWKIEIQTTAEVYKNKQIDVIGREYLLDVSETSILYINDW